jgi:hypothetical protein
LTLALGGLAACAPAAQAATVYRTVDPDGTVSYSDRPPPAGTPVQVIETIEPAPADPVTDHGTPVTYADEWTYDTAAEPSAPAYRSMAWVTPVHDAAVRANGGSFEVAVALTPDLQPGHRIEILLDGVVVGRAAATTVTTTAVDRGSHQLEARVLDDAGTTLMTLPAITIHVLRHSVRAPNHSG